MELEAAKLLSQLISHVANALCINATEIFTWIDSTTVLAWLKKPLIKLKTFVCNRVAMINELLPLQHGVMSPLN